MRRIIIIIALSTPLVATAQKERADIRSGNKLFEFGKYTQAEVEYKRALDKNINSYEATFNLGGALYKQGRYEDATTYYQKLAEDSSNPANQAKALYNLGNAMMQLKPRKLDEAIESYKSSLRINPTDTQAKFNLAYAQKLKEEEDKKKDQKQDPKPDPKQEPDKKNDKKDPDKKDQKQDPPPARPESDRMLKAMQAAEDKTKEKVDKQREQAVGKGSGKQW